MKRQFHLLPLFAAAVMSVALARPAEAATATASMTITATVQPTCQITAASLDLGVYTGQQRDGSATLSVTCTNTTPYYINIGPGLNPDGSGYPTMAGAGAARLPYRLYQDASRTIPWRNTLNVDGQAGTGTGSAQTLTVYGRISAGNFVAPGTYSDTVVVTVNY